MAYVYLDDGGPESEDYDSNYFYFDESNLTSVALIEKMLTSKAERNQAFREQLDQICRDSLSNAGRNNKKKSWKAKNWVKGLSHLIQRLSYKHKFGYARDCLSAECS